MNPNARANILSDNEKDTTWGRVVNLAATATLKPCVQHAVITTAGGAITLTLPNATECLEQGYGEITVWLQTAGNALTIAAGADSAIIGTTNLAIDTANDFFLLKTNGVKWFMYTYEV